MNNVAFYDKDKHYEMVKSWYQGWGGSGDVVDILPPTGYVVEGICAMFVYETNGPVAFIEGMIRNPKVPQQIADECLDQIGDKICEYAKARGFQYVSSYSKYTAVALRAQKHGFRINTRIDMDGDILPQSYYSFSKFLGDK